MIPALIALVGVLIATAGQLIGQLVSARNDRALAHQEVDLLKKLERGQAAADLEAIINSRIRKWRRSYEVTRVTLKQAWALLGVASVAVALAIPLVLYVKPEAWSGLPALARTITLVLLGGAAVSLVGSVALTVVYLFRTLKQPRAKPRQSSASAARARSGSS
jgi:hypothetical protein